MIYLAYWIKVNSIDGGIQWRSITCLCLIFISPSIKSDMTREEEVSEGK